MGKERDEINGEDYKHSEWADLIDSSAKLAKVAGDQKLAEWSDWMKKEGYRLSDKGVAAKTRELVGMSDAEQSAMVRELIEEIRSDPDRGEG